MIRRMPGIVVRAYGKFFTVQLARWPRAALHGQGRLLKRRATRHRPRRCWRPRAGFRCRGRRGTHRARRAAHPRPLAPGPAHGRCRASHPGQPGPGALPLCGPRTRSRTRGLLDRFLVMAESRELPALIGVNKMDLEQPGPERQTVSSAGDLRRLRDVSTLSTISARKPAPRFPELRRSARRQRSPRWPDLPAPASRVCSTPSIPRDSAAVGAISAATGKGRHTTIATVLASLAG